MHVALRPHRSAGVVMVGLAAATGAIGAAAIIAGVTAPAARADDFTAIVNAVDAVLGAGSLDFGNAVTDFSTADYPDGSYVAPTDLIDTLNDAQAVVSLAGTELTTAANDFASSDPSDGLLYAFTGLDSLLIGDPEILGIGLTDTLLGSL